MNKVLNGLSLVTKNDFISDAEGKIALNRLKRANKYIDPHLQEDLQRPAQELILVSFNLLKTCVKLNPELIKDVYAFPDLTVLFKNGFFFPYFSY